MSGVCFSGMCDTSALPAVRAAAKQDLGEQLRRLMETAAQLVQFLLHGEDPLLQLPIRVVPVGAQVAHDHLHLLNQSHDPGKTVCINTHTHTQNPRAVQLQLLTHQGF